jgi:hypothetical protein
VSGGVSSGSSGGGVHGVSPAPVSLGVAEELARHVISFLTASVRRLVDVLLSALQPAISSQVGNSAASASSDRSSGVFSASIDPLVSILAAVRSVFADCDTRDPDG